MKSGGAYRPNTTNSIAKATYSARILELGCTKPNSKNECRPTMDTY